MNAVRVLIVDDQALVRAGFRAILEAAGGIEVVGEAADGAQASRLAATLRPDLVLLDVRMPGVDGLVAARRILAQPDPPKVVMLTTFDLDEYVYEAMRAGASGFLLKDVPREQLITAVRTVARDDALLSPSITRRLVAEFLRRPRPGSTRPAALQRLSDREIQVLCVLARGLSNTEIAGALFVGEATVKTHIARILTKLGVRDRLQAAVMAYETGLVQPGADPHAPPR